MYSNNIQLYLFNNCHNLHWLLTGIHSQLHGPKFKFTVYLYLNLFFTELHRHSRHCMLCKERSLLHDVLGIADPLSHLWAGLHC